MNANTTKLISVAVMAGVLAWAVPIRSQDLNIEIPLPGEAGKDGAASGKEARRRAAQRGEHQQNVRRGARQQQPLDEAPLAPTEPAPGEPTLAEPLPTDPAPADPAPQGPDMEPGRTFEREHTVTTPNGQMTQRWEGSANEEGYQFRREQTWTNPDGTPLRQHERSLSGTDPLNFQREHSITLRDGRTIEHSTTQTWDGQVLQRERTFTGPNGQTQTKQHDWTAPSSPSPSPSPPASRPSGFTMGSSGRGGFLGRGHGAAARQPGQTDSTPAVARRNRIEHRLREREPDLPLPRPQWGKNR